jgi:hypothetical protein
MAPVAITAGAQRARAGTEADSAPVRDFGRLSGIRTDKPRTPDNTEAVFNELNWHPSCFALAPFPF